MSTKDVIGQEILCYDSVGSISKLLDQFSSGLCATGLLEVMKTFLFTYTATLIQRVSKLNLVKIYHMVQL